jgi:hypothetical protein
MLCVYNPKLPWHDQIFARGNMTNINKHRKASLRDHLHLSLPVNSLATVLNLFDNPI